MKKTLFCVVLGLAMCLCGCVKEVSYVNKYIADYTGAEFHQDPSNASTILYNLNFGEIVSFEKYVENGYSKVVYEGVTGYVLSTSLSNEKPEIDSQNYTTPKPANNEKQLNKGLISNQSEGEIENYITGFVRPLYNRINENIDSYSKQSSGNATLWYDDNGCVKKELPQGADNYNMSRQYYYDTNSGEMVFAFVFKGTQEYRLYFNNGKLVRYIDEIGNVINNPTSSEALKIAEHAIGEAY